jgi:hypothetical protein
MSWTITTRPIRRAGGSAALKARGFLPCGLRAVLLSCAVMNLASADDTVPTPMSPPAHTLLRYDENYSFLKDPAARKDPLDKLKYIPLSEPGDSYLTLGGELRDRYENFHNYVFGSGPQDPNGYNLLRVMLDADLPFSPQARVFVEGIDATEQGRFGGPRSSDVNRHDLYQAFVDGAFPLGANTSFTLRGGRQNIIDVHPGFTLTLLKNKPGAKQLTLLTQYRRFWRENNQDAVYTSSGSILRTDTASRASAIGGEIDLQTNWQLDRHVGAYADYGRFSPGPFIAATGPASRIHFLYSALTITF